MGDRRRWLNDEDLAALRTEDIPEHLHQGVIDYIELGLKPGAFLWCVLGNDLQGAILRADGRSVLGLRALVRWLCTHAPATSWGSEKKRDEWQEVQQGNAAADTVERLRAPLPDWRT